MNQWFPLMRPDKTRVSEGATLGGVGWPAIKNDGHQESVWVFITYYLRAGQWYHLDFAFLAAYSITIVLPIPCHVSDGRSCILSQEVHIHTTKIFDPIIRDCKNLDLRNQVPWDFFPLCNQWIKELDIKVGQLPLSSDVARTGRHATFRAAAAPTRRETLPKKHEALED